MGAVHVLSLATGSLLFKWQAPADGAGFNRATGTSTWQEAVQGRCKPKRPGQELCTPQGPVPQGFHPHWRAMKGALALDDGTAALLPSGRISVLTGPSSSDLLYCQGPMRAFLWDRNTGTVTRSWFLADLLGEPMLPADASGPWLTHGPAGPWYVCTNRGCSPLKLAALRK
ncbi:MAG: hypothetical protein NZ869_07995 [Thermoanaerobaculum sp.]|nr:hypothetical protein [Thermoanaerobaculum sp.]MDW7966983.1 hypothetical protein [Thermoanaerobaculum sp.]